MPDPVAIGIQVEIVAGLDAEVHIGRIDEFPLFYRREKA
jgi:hypothetical protein